MVAAITYPERVRKFVMGGSHIGTGGDRYLLANRPSEGSRATRQALDDPSRENIRHYLSVHIDDESLVTDELIDYIHRAHTWSQEFIEARRQSVSLPHDYTPDLAGIQAPVLLIHGRYDRMVPFEVSIAILNHIADSRLVLLNNCGHWPPFEKPAEWTAQVLAFLQRLLRGTARVETQSARRLEPFAPRHEVGVGDLFRQHGEDRVAADIGAPQNGSSVNRSCGRSTPRNA